MTPKTSRTTYQCQPTPNSSFSRSSHVTPDQCRSPRDSSFTTPIKSKPTESADVSFQKDALNEPKLSRCDRSQRAFKTTLIKDNPMKEEDKTFLRQTVSNLNLWRKTKAVDNPPSPHKLFSELSKEKKTSNF